MGADLFESLDFQINDFPPSFDKEIRGVVLRGATGFGWPTRCHRGGRYHNREKQQGALRGNLGQAAIHGSKFAVRKNRRAWPGREGAPVQVLCLYNYS
jgi:hypothetical protein